jgi:hypothetical protein
MIKNTNKSSFGTRGRFASRLLMAVLAALIAASPAMAASRTNGARRPADINRDGVVNVSDLILMLGDFRTDGSCRGDACRSDLNGDGFVNSTDVAILLADIG